MNHYVYKTTYPKTNEFYIGVCSCNCDPRLDKYLGSGSFISDYSKSDFRKEIIAVFESRDMAEVFEFALISKENLTSRIVFVSKRSLEQLLLLVLLETRIRSCLLAPAVDS